jgi:hypothetical protein
MIYGIFFITGWGICVHICKGKNDQYKFFLAPVLGMLPLSIIPIYFSIFGVETSITGWVTFVLFSCFSIYSLIKTPPTLKKIKWEYFVLLLLVLLAATPSFIIILRAGYLTSTLQSYSAFTTIPADYFIHNSVSQKVLIDFDRPITKLLADVIDHKEYFGFFFVIAAIASITSIPPYKLHLVLSAIIGSFIPISAFIASKEGFNIKNKQALFISLLISINFSYFVWPVIGQMPIIAGIVYLILVLGFIPSMLHCKRGVDYILYSAFVAGILATYPILICYAFGIFAFYSLYYIRSSHTKLLPFINILKLGLATFIINPFTFIFFGLHGMDIIATTSKFTKNIPRYPYLEELLGFGQHFAIIHDGSIQSYLTLVIILLAVLFVCAGCYNRFRGRDHLFICTFTFIFILGCFFYIIDFTYHFYKNAIIGVYALIFSLVTGASWIYRKTRYRSLKMLISAMFAVFIVLNINTLINYSLASHRLINKSLINIEGLSAIIPTGSRILVDSHDPTEEAWISYFLRDNKIKLRGSIEPWGFWILSPFSGKPDFNFFYDPNKDTIDYTLSSRPLSRTDIIETEYGKIIYRSDPYILSKDIPSPYLVMGWYHVEGGKDAPLRWTDRQSSVLFAKPAQDSLLQLKGTIPAVYTEPLEVSVYMNANLIDRFSSEPSSFNKRYLLSKGAFKGAHNLLSLVLDNSFCPNEAGNSSDLRRLGIMVTSIALFPAENLRASGLIDIGASEYDKYLVSGWSHNEITRDKMSFRWVDGTKASLNVFVDQAQEMEMEFRAYPFCYPGGPLQKTRIYLNDRFTDSVVLDDGGWSVHSIRIPSDAWKRGLNIIEFAFHSCASPADVLENSSDPRCLSAAFDYIKFSRDAHDSSDH